MAIVFDTVEFHDIDQYMKYVTASLDIRSIQLQSGMLTIKNSLLQLGNVSVTHYSTNRNLLDNFSIPPKHILFALTSTIKDDCKWCGIDVPVNSLGILHPQREHQAFMPANWDSIGILLKDETIMQESLLSEYLWKQTLQPGKAIFRQESTRIKDFRSKLLGYFQLSRNLSFLQDNEFARLGLQYWIIDELRMILAEVDEYQNRHTIQDRHFSRRYRTFTRAIMEIEDNLKNSLSVSQICNQIGTTPRTLQLTFKELTGVSLLQYITSRKLHAVKQELSKSRDSTIPIFQVAQDYGLYHAGRFSQQYNRMFSELPHTTVKRRAR